MPSFPGASVLTTLVAAEVTADGNTGGVDISDYNGEVIVTLAAANTAGTTPTLAVKLQHTSGAVAANTVAADVGNTGNGTITEVDGGPDAVAETFTLTASNATTFAVVGSVSGSLGNATVGTKFVNAKCTFLITAGGTAFESGDIFTFKTTLRTYADVAGGGFTSLTDNKLGQKLAINTDKLGKYLRLNFDIGGTDTPSYEVVSTVIGVK